MPDSKGYFLNLYLILNVEYIVFFWLKIPLKNVSKSYAQVLLSFVLGFPKSCRILKLNGLSKSKYRFSQGMVKLGIQAVSLIIEAVACMQTCWDKQWTYITENELLKFIIKSRSFMQILLVGVVCSRFFFILNIKSIFWRNLWIKLLKQKK